MTPLRRGLLLAAIQVALVASVGAKFVIDRHDYPRVWIQTWPYDPDLPIRGRYVRLSAVTRLEGEDRPAANSSARRVSLAVRNGALVATPDANGRHDARAASCGKESCWLLSEPLAYFIPEHIPDPSRRKPGEELWVEATIPPNGPPRPIRLGIKAGGKISPLDIL